MVFLCYICNYEPGCDFAIERLLSEKKTHLDCRNVNLCGPVVDNWNSFSYWFCLTSIVSTYSHTYHLSPSSPTRLYSVLPPTVCMFWFRSCLKCLFFCCRSLHHGLGDKCYWKADVTSGTAAWKYERCVRKTRDRCGCWAQAGKLRRFMIRTDRTKKSAIVLGKLDWSVQMENGNDLCFNHCHSCWVIWLHCFF